MEAQIGGVKRAEFSITMTVVFFIVFAGVHWFLSQRTIEPHYYLELIFAIPLASFAVVTNLFLMAIKACPILITVMTVFEAFSA